MGKDLYDCAPLLTTELPTLLSRREARSAAAFMRAYSLWSRPVTFGTAATLYLSVGSTAADAAEGLVWARSSAASMHEAAAVAAAAAYLASARLPAVPLAAPELFLAKRALLVMRSSTASWNSSGAIVASVASNPQYRFVAPRMRNLATHAAEYVSHKKQN